MYTWKALKVLWVVSTPPRLLDSRDIPAFLGLTHRCCFCYKQTNEKSCLVNVSYTHFLSLVNYWLRAASCPSNGFFQLLVGIFTIPSVTLRKTNSQCHTGKNEVSVSHWIFLTDSWYFPDTILSQILTNSSYYPIQGTF